MTPLITPQHLRDRGLIQLNVPDGIVLPIIRKVHDIELEPTIGDGLLKALETKKAAGTLTSGNYFTLYNEYVIDVLCYATMAELVLLSSYQIYTKGLVKKSDTFQDSLNYEEIERISDKYKQDMESYKSRMMRFLDKYKSNYAELESNDITESSDSYSVSIYLRDDNEKCER